MRLEHSLDDDRGALDEDEAFDRALMALGSGQENTSAGLESLPQSVQADVRQIHGLFRRFQIGAVDLEPFRNEVDQRIEDESRARRTARSSGVRQSRWRSMVGAGLALAGIVATAGLVYRNVNSTGASVVQQFHTAAGQRSTIRLGDGSTILIAPSTNLAIQSRTVTVDGEAYFTVVPNHAQPFVVQTRNASAQVLGTSFGVRQYPNEPSTRVVVEDGKVALSTFRGNQKPAVLSARMMGIADDSAIHVTDSVSLSACLGVRTGQLVFEGTPLRDAVIELSRLYGTTIQVNDSILSRQSITMQVSATTHPLSRVLEMISRATESHYVRERDAFIFVPGASITRTPRRNQLSQVEKLYGR